MGRISLDGKHGEGWVINDYDYDYDDNDGDDYD